MNEPYYSEPDPMDEQVRDSLRRYAPPAPEAVWDRIEAQLPDKEERRRAIWLWLASLGLVVFMAWGGYAIYQDINGKRQDLRQAPPAWVNDVAVKNQDIEPSRFQRPTPGMEESQPCTRPVGLVGKGQDRSGQQYKTAPALGSGTKTQARQSASGEGTALLATDRNDVHVESLRSDEAILSTLLPYPFVLVYSTVQPAPQPKLWPVAPNVVSQPASNQRRKLEVGVVAAPVWSLSTASGHQQPSGHSLVFAESVHTSSGNQLGLSLGYRIGRQWRIETGLRWQASQQHTSHSASLRLMDGVCLNPYDPGVKNYEFQYALLSAAGQSDVTVRISQVDPHVAMPADETFVLQMQTTRRQAEWFVPVTVQRLFGRGAWQVGLRAGTALGWAGKTTLRVDHYTEQCIDLCFSSDHTPAIDAEAQRGMQVNFMTGVGLYYQLTNRIQLAAEPVVTGTLIKLRSQERQARLAAAVQAIYSF
jgi:hypothetical protein